MINHILNKSFCLHNMFVFCAHLLYSYIIYLENIYMYIYRSDVQPIFYICS